jgi:hypothetical protein
LKIATDIKTEDWNKIIEGLMKDGWKLKMKYDGFDAGIDFDFLMLKKKRQKIEFGWDNWVEGEIKCSDELMEILENKFNLKFKFGEPLNLKPSVIRITKVQIMLNRIALLKKNKTKHNE